MEEICYENNFITEAIAKVEFVSPIHELKESIPDEFVELLRSKFPIAEPKQVVDNLVRVGPTDVKREVEELTEWTFWNTERNRKVTVTKNVLLLIQTRYTSFEDFSAEFITALNALHNSFPKLKSRRFGVRYINNIGISEDKPLDWDEYINSELIASIKIPKDKECIIRTFHNLEMNYGEFDLRFQFGIHNPDYPAIIKRKVFVLDMDAYSTGIQSKLEIEESLGKYHEKIQEFFEYSITEQFRENHLRYE